MVINIELVRDITCTLMHCYAPNFEEVEGANWFGPVRLFSHLPAPPPTPPNTFPAPPPPPKKKKRVEFFVKKNCRLKVMVTHEGQMIKWSLILSLSGTLLVHECIVMPPTSKKLKGQIGLGLFVCPSIYPSPRPPLNPPNPLPPPKKKKKKNT